MAAWLSFAGSNMAGKKGRSGRKPASARAAFIAFAEGYEADKRRAILWLELQHLAAKAGDGQAGRFLLEQYIGKANQHLEVAEEKSDQWYKLQREIAGLKKDADSNAG